MTRQDVVKAAFADSEHDSWITLPSVEIHVPRRLLAAIDAFDAGERPAALAAAQWLKTEALGAFQTARTHLAISNGRVEGFYSLASAHVALSQRDRRRLGVDPVRVPAALVAWIARDIHAGVDGKKLLLHAAATARQVAAAQATAVLVVDPFDEETARMWRRRFGFRPSAESADRRRLWLPLQVVC